MIMLALSWRQTPAPGGSVATVSLFSTKMMILQYTTYLFHMSVPG